MEKTYENILVALKYYIPIKYWNLNNWKIIIYREKEVKKNVFEYKCSFFTLYFNEKLEPVTYGRQYVIDNEVYYDENESDIGAGTYTLLGVVDWSSEVGWGM